MKPGLWIIAIHEGGCEIWSEGPFESEEDRSAQAKNLWAEMRAVPGSNIFKAEVDKNGELSTGLFIDGELDSEEEDNDCSSNEG